MSRFGYLNKKAEMVQRWPIHLHLSPLFCISEARFKSGSLSDDDDDNAAVPSKCSPLIVLSEELVSGCRVYDIDHIVHIELLRRVYHKTTFIRLGQVRAILRGIDRHHRGKIKKLAYFIQMRVSCRVD